MISFQYSHYKIFSLIDKNSSERILSICHNPSKFNILTLKDNHRTFVGLFKFNNNFYVYKIPRSRNERSWERLLTLFRGSDTRRSFNSLIVLKNIGFNGPQPILFGECCKLGFTLDSFYIYEYIDGEECSIEDTAAIVSIMNRLHLIGYTRRDVQIRNFIKSPDSKISLIDFRLKKPIFFKSIRINFERNRMIRDIPGSVNYLPINSLNNFSFLIVKNLTKLLSFFRIFIKKFIFFKSGQNQ